MKPIQRLSFLLSFTFLATTVCLQATPVPRNMGNGLTKLYLQAVDPAAIAQRADAAINFDRHAIRDNAGRILVSIRLDGRAPIDNVRATVAAIPAVQVTAEDRTYRAGIIEAYIPAASAALVAQLPGVRAVHLVPKPVTNVGATDSQGIVQHRVDKLPANINGAGVTVGAMSDSYDTSTQDALGAPQTVRAAQDVQTGDLPNDVRVVEDFTAAAGSSTIDEGRGMLQLIHDMAPGAKLAFATAFTGEIGFANNIRRLAAPVTGNPVTTGGGCQVIVDDVIYLNEPMFADGPIARAVDDVAAQGVTYHSSAGNNPGTQAYASDVRIVPNNPAALTGTNINLTGVPLALYASGFHDFDPGAGQDIAQTINAADDRLVFQYDDPYDTVTAPAVSPTVIQSGSGTVTAKADPAGGTNPVDFPFVNNVAGQQIEIFADGDGSLTELSDVVIAVFDPSGRQIGFEDTITSPERFLIFLPTTGTYTIRIDGFDATPGAAGGESTGGFIYEVRQANGVSFVMSDFNLLFFDATGAFVGATTDDNRATNQPIEISTVPSDATQLVIARANTPAASPVPASHMRYVIFGSGTPTEFFSYLSPATYGHSCAAGGNGIAAYSPFRPYVPESFTSPGPVTIYFNNNNQRLATPELRLKPNLAALDGANTTFFPTLAPEVGDSDADDDQFPNFFGTSAAAPHSAAIAALVLQAKGGPGSVSPAQMRIMLQRSAFPHDLDPFFARAIARAGTSKVTATITGNGELLARSDPNAFQVNYIGGSSLLTAVFDGRQGNSTQNPKGLVFDGTFLKGNSVGVANADFSSTTTENAEPPSQQKFYKFNISVIAGRMTGGDIIHFGKDREERDAAGALNDALDNGNSADLFAPSILIPDGIISTGAVTLSGTLQDGSTYTAPFVNRIGAGYSPLDGYGFINAQSAVNQPLPARTEFSGR